jgi:hypothetical protein
VFLLPIHGVEMKNLGDDSIDLGPFSGLTVEF